MKWAAGQTLGHISFYDNIQIMCRRLFTGEGKNGCARGREMFKMHAYKTLPLDKNAQWKYESPSTSGNTKKTPGLLMFLLWTAVEKKSIGKISIMGFNCICMHARSVIGKKNCWRRKSKKKRQTHSERVGKINGEHNGKARANFSHFPTLCPTLLCFAFASCVLCPSKN